MNRSPLQTKISYIQNSDSIKIQDRGFTLIELLLVTILLSIIAGIALPSFKNSFTGIQVEQTAKDLTYLMKYAQSRAITKNNEVRLEFSDDFSEFWLTEAYTETNEEDPVEASFRRISSRLGKAMDVAPGAEIESPSQHVSFYSDGQIEKVRIYICEEERCLTVSTKEQRGFVKRYDSRIEE